jgi:hypothetical protein
MSLIEDQTIFAVFGLALVTFPALGIIHIDPNHSDVLETFGLGDLENLGPESRGAKGIVVLAVNDECHFLVLLRDLKKYSLFSEACQVM